MVPSLVKEASGLYTVRSTLYMQPSKADKDSVFQCTVEYSMPGDQIKQKKSDTINLNLNCERTKWQASFENVCVERGSSFVVVLVILPTTSVLSNQLLLLSNPPLRVQVSHATPGLNGKQNGQRWQQDSSIACFLRFGLSR